MLVKGVLYSYSYYDSEPLTKVEWKVCYADIYNNKGLKNLILYIPVEYNTIIKDNYPQNSLIFSKEQIENYIGALNKMQLFCDIEENLYKIIVNDVEYNCYVIDVDCQRTTHTGIKLLLNAIRYMFENTLDEKQYLIVKIFLSLLKIDNQEPIHNLWLLAHNLSNCKPTGHNIIDNYDERKCYTIEEWDELLSSNIGDLKYNMKTIPKELWIEFKKKFKSLKEKIENFKNI